MLAASFFFALMNVLVKLVPDVPAIQVVFIRSVVSLVLSILFLWSRGLSFWGKNKKLLLLRGGSGAVALVLFFYTLQVMPLASAVTIQFMSPVFTAILGIFLAKEKVGTFQWFCFAFSFAGVVVVNGFDDRITPFLLALGIIASVFSGLAFNFIRMINVSEHPMVIVFYFPLVTLPFTGAWSVFGWTSPTPWQWGILVCIGIVVQLAQFLMTRAYQLEEISKIASIKYTGIVYALIFGWLFFDEHFNYQSYLGMAMVLIGVMANLAYKRYSTK